MEESDGKPLVCNKLSDGYEGYVSVTFRDGQFITITPDNDIANAAVNDWALCIVH